MTRQVVLDANVLIRHFERSHPQHHQASAALAAIDAPLVINNVTLAEVLVGPVRSGMGEQVREAIITEIGVEIFDGIGDGWSLSVATIRATATPKLSTPDAIVLATAHALGAQVATFDNALLKCASSRSADYPLG